MNRRRHWTVAIDFDGTIVDHAFPDIGELKAGAKEAIEKLYEEYEIVISSCRASKLYEESRKERDFVQEMELFLIENGIPFDRIDRGDEGKVVAVAYIDDRAKEFVGWDKEYLEPKAPVR